LKVGPYLHGAISLYQSDDTFLQRQLSIKH